MKSTISFLFKVTVTILSLYYIFSTFEYIDVFESIKHADPWLVACGVICLCSQIPITTARWKVLIKSVGHHSKFSTVFKIIMIGQFFNQTTPALVVGDAMRVWFLKRESIPLGRALFSVGVERFIGMASLLLMVVFGMLHLEGHEFSLIVNFLLKMVLALGMLSVLLLLWVGGKSSEFLFQFFRLSAVREIFVQFHGFIWLWPNGLNVFVLSFLVHVLSILALFCFSLSINLNVDLVQLFLIIPPVMFLAALPISFAGWGVRESAMVQGLGVIGIGGVESITVSVVYGASLLFIYLPGGIIWLRS